MDETDDQTPRVLKVPNKHVELVTLRYGVCGSWRQHDVLGFDYFVHLLKVP